jgi:outer membrane lipoprotein SlyB
LIGGAGGAVLGAVFGGGLKGTIIGGAAGAGIGAVVGQAAQSKRDNNYHHRPY